jgi:hypothetical protein
MKKEFEISVSLVRKVQDSMEDIIRLFGYQGIEIEQTSSNTFEFEDEEDEVEIAIVELMETLNISSDEYSFNEI